jgi:hypothetical protein
VIAAVHASQVCLGKFSKGQRDALVVYVSGEKEPRIYLLNMSEPVRRTGASTTSFSGRLVSNTKIEVGSRNDVVTGSIINPSRPGIPDRISFETESNLRMTDATLSVR